MGSVYFLLVTLPASLLFLGNLSSVFPVPVGNEAQCVSCVLLGTVPSVSPVSCWELCPLFLLCPAGNCAQCVSCVLLGTVPSVSPVSCWKLFIVCLLLETGFSVSPVSARHLASVSLRNSRDSQKAAD
jgi:hypothetical protein